MLTSVIAEAGLGESGDGTATGLGESTESAEGGVAVPDCTISGAAGRSVLTNSNDVLAGSLAPASLLPLPPFSQVWFPRSNL